MFVPSMSTVQAIYEIAGLYATSVNSNVFSIIEPPNWISPPVLP